MQINNDGRIIIDNLPVHEFLEFIPTPYTNDHGVGIRINLSDEDRVAATEDRVCVTAVWHTGSAAMPFHEETVIASVGCSTIDQFMQVFGIDDAMGINAITPARLLYLYLKGIAIIECTVSHLYDYYSLLFSLSPIKKEPEDTEDTVAVWLHTPEQFVQYTRQYFRLNELPVSEKEKLECEVYYYLEDRSTFFQNKWEVKFSTEGAEPGEKDIKSLTISAAWPYCTKNESTTELLLFYEVSGVAPLIETFELTSAAGLADITPMQLQQLYNQGKACIYCWLEDEDDSLYFKLQRDGAMLAAENYIGKDNLKGLHAVPELFQTAEQFIDYTRQYWRYVRLFG